MHLIDLISLPIAEALVSSTHYSKIPIVKTYNVQAQFQTYALDTPNF